METETITIAVDVVISEYLPVTSSNFCELFALVPPSLGGNYMHGMMFHFVSAYQIQIISHPLSRDFLCLGRFTLFRCFGEIQLQQAACGVFRLVEVEVRNTERKGKLVSLFKSDLLGGRPYFIVDLTSLL